MAALGRALAVPEGREARLNVQISVCERVAGQQHRLVAHPPTLVVLEEDFISNRSFLEKFCQSTVGDADRVGEGCRALCIAGMCELRYGRLRSRGRPGAYLCFVLFFSSLPPPPPPTTCPGGGSTSRHRAMFGALRSCTKNVVAMSVGLLSEPANERTFFIIHHCGKNLLRWDAAYRAAPKDSDACESARRPARTCPMCATSPPPSRTRSRCATASS